MRIPFKGGDEWDALSRRARCIHKFKPGQRKKSKKSYNRRFRRILKTFLKQELEED